MHALKRKRASIFLGDIISFYGALVAVLAIRTSLSGNTLSVHGIPFSILFALWVLVFFLFNLYEPDAANPTPRTVGRLLIAFVVNFFLGVLLFYAIPHFGIAPKSNLVLVTLAACVLVICIRRLVYHYFQWNFRKEVVFYGDSELMSAFKKMLHAHEHFHMNPTVITTTSDVAALAAVPDILIVPSKLSHSEIAYFATYSGEIARIDTAYERLFAKIPLSVMTEGRALSLLERRVASQSAFTRTMELVIASLVLLMTLPVTVIAGLAVVLDGGPMFIKQKRVGKNGSIFTLYKFRSMKALAPDGSAETNGAVWAQKRDPRITWIGRILRVTHIDEIPQMWNIMTGDLALVGPRAERPEFVATLEQEIPYYYLRHTVQPGFTGWAQIKYRYARSVDDTREKLEYDLYYIKHRNTLLDLGIIVKTLQIIFTH